MPHCCTFLNINRKKKHSGQQLNKRAAAKYAKNFTKEELCKDFAKRREALKVGGGTNTHIYINEIHVCKCVCKESDGKVVLFPGICVNLLICA